MSERRVQEALRQKQTHCTVVGLFSRALSLGLHGDVQVAVPQRIGFIQRFSLGQSPGLM